MKNSIATKDDTEFGEHIRQTLLAVAETVQLEAGERAANPTAADTPASNSGSSTRSFDTRRDVDERASRTKRLSGRSIAVAAALVIACLGIVGWKALGPGDIERIPTEAALVTGIADGYEWWLIPSAAIEGRANPCGVPHPGVEMVSAATNRPGEQWNTGGVGYGDRNPSGTRTAIDSQSGVFTYDCTNPTSDFDEAAWLPDPALHDVGFTRLGRNNDAGSPWGAFVAVHPSIDHIDVIVDGQVIETVATVTTAENPDGARYGGFTIPSDVCTFSLDYLSGTQTITTDQRTLC